MFKEREKMKEIKDSTHACDDGSDVIIALEHLFKQRLSELDESDPDHIVLYEHTMRLIDYIRKTLNEAKKEISSRTEEG